MKNISITVPVIAEEDAVRQKEKLLNTKLFGLFSPVKYTTKSVKKVYVPFELLVFSYEINFGGRKREGKKTFLNRSGQTGIVYNIKEDHAFHFDLIESIDRINKSSESLNGEILADGCSSEEVLNNSLMTMKRKVLGRTYRNVSDLNVVSRERFYRPALEMIVEARGKEFVKYAYMDDYSSTNEHVSGLKTRLQN